MNGLTFAEKLELSILSVIIILEMDSFFVEYRRHSLKFKAIMLIVFK